MGENWHPSYDTDLEVPWSFGDIWSFYSSPPPAEPMPVTYPGWWAR
jgi:hypothetical protein